MTSSVMGISTADAHSATFFKAGMKGASAFKAVAHGLSRAAIAKVRDCEITHFAVSNINS